MPPKLDYESVSALAWRLTAASLLLPLKAPFSRGTSARQAIVQTLHRFLVAFTESPYKEAFEGYLAGFYTYPVAIPLCLAHN